MMRFALLLLLLTFGCVRPLSAQYFVRSNRLSLQGDSPTRINVREKEGDNLLLGATVTIASDADTLRGVTVKQNTYFGVTARYDVDRIFRDSVDLEVTYVGYKTYQKRYSGREFYGYIDVEMEVDEQAIAQVVVTGKQIAMVFRGDTTVYNAGAFKTMADDRLSELIRQLPGVEIKDNKIYANGEEVKRVYVDGKNLFGNNASHSLTDMEASDVKNVRVYEEQNPTAKRVGDTSAEKEKVMDVETKSKRGVLLGGEISATGGASLEQDYSSRHEIRHAEALMLYRHSEKGSLRLKAANSKDDSEKDMASMQSKITPSKATSAGFTHEYRHGDSTQIWSMAEFRRNRHSSVSSSATEYFPTEEYALRTNENQSESRSKNYFIGLNNNVLIQRKRNSLVTSVDFGFDKGTYSGLNQSRQAIDDDVTRTRINSDNNDRNIDLNVQVSYTFNISKNSWLTANASLKYANGHDNDWQVDTLASSPGLRMILNSGGRTWENNVSAGLDFRHKAGENNTLTAGYSFSREYKHARQLSVDYFDHPEGEVDTTNSYNYTVDYYKHDLSAAWVYNRKKFRSIVALNAGIYSMARDELFPEQEHSPRLFYQLNPMLSLSFGENRKRLSLFISSRTQMISSEALRSTLNATNPLLLQAGNPDLKLPNSVNSSLRYYFNDAKSARSLSVGLSGSYTFNYITTRRTLFLKDTYLEKYDYTARKGSQLTTQLNVGGNYNISTYFSYSQQLSLLRSTFRGGMDYSFSQSPYFLDERLYHSGSHSLGIDMSINTGFSTKVKLSLASMTNMSSYETQKEIARDLRETVNARIDLRFGKWFGYVGTLYEFYCNSRSKTLTRHNVILNAAAGRKFGKENRMALSAGVVDVLNRPDYATTRFETDFIQTSTTSYLGRYAYLRAAYTF